MESETSIAALSLLHPLLALRYSATHRNPYNLVYRLTPYDAYRLGLVKRIEVAGATTTDTNQPYVRLEATRSQRQIVRAKLRVRKMQKDGTIKEVSLTVRHGEDLRKKTNLPQYEGLVVDEIDVTAKMVHFTNGVSLRVGQDTGADKEALFREQILYTVQQHARKQRRLQDRGIKVVSLFFIDRVDNYAGPDPLIRRLFEEAFLAHRDSLEMWHRREPSDVQAAYFAQRRTREGQVILQDSSSGEAQKDEEAYDLIMRDKERLLSFDDPHCFIFSHSALREGWDNPNVCQICTLNQTGSELRKRQEIGRGVRLVVDQRGMRVRDEEQNVLTVVANESYEHYVAQLQQEVESEFGRPDAAPLPANARERIAVRPRKEYQLKPEFKELWERIKHKTRYLVSIDTDRLIEDAVAELDQETIEPPKVRVEKALVQVGDEGFEAVRVGGHQTDAPPQAHSALEVLRAMEHLMLQTTPPMRLTRRTLSTIWEGTTNQEASLTNPQDFAGKAVGIIKRHLADQLVRGIEYEKLGEWWEMTKLDEEFESWRDYVVPADKSYYDQVVWESSIEREFVEALEAREDVLLYIKLPGWFTVPTPIGEYNPDWAIVMGDEQIGDEARLYLVRETKSTTDPDKLHPDERRRIDCGKRHFRDALGVDYKVVTRASELP
jgi:type III restriction enzyme